MAEGEDVIPVDNEDPEETPGYKAPAQKSLQQIQEQDQDDESLVKYKQALLAGVDNDAGKAFEMYNLQLFAIMSQTAMQGIPVTVH